ncbi:hypothetical protein C1708_00085 [Streptomyces sp. DH-12]|uniref:hypothetical protein n=1 Tax=unclassified Streptomyces TaxID=2593676 RepID=UPI000CCF64E2|nr:hypothetical protein [Streptomyces sp. DH-12]PNV36476.1 hypothetical protein C1708_00085 [Streptomyces sp. DH-12]
MPPAPSPGSGGGRLLEHRDRLVPDEGAESWLDEAAEVLPHCGTPTQMAGPCRSLDAAVRALGKWEQPTARPATTSDEARPTWPAAVEFLAR